MNLMSERTILLTLSMYLHRSIRILVMSKKVRKVTNKKMKNEPCLVGVGANTTYYVRVCITNSDVLQLKMMMLMDDDGDN